MNIREAMEGRTTESVGFIVEQGPSKKAALERVEILEQLTKDLYRQINLTDTRCLRQYHKDLYDSLATAIKAVVEAERKVMR